MPNTDLNPPAKAQKSPVSLFPETVVKEGSDPLAQTPADYYRELFADKEPEEPEEPEAPTEPKRSTKP